MCRPVGVRLSWCDGGFHGKESSEQGWKVWRLWQGHWEGSQDFNLRIHGVSSNGVP